MLTKTIKIDLIFRTVSVLTALMLSACGGRDRDHGAAAAAPAPTAATTPGPTSTKIETKDQSCRTLIDSYNPSTAKFAARTQTYNVERHFQRVIRKDCRGLVTSDEIETVQSPHVPLRLFLPKPHEFKSVFLFNETSCDHVLSGTPKEPTLVGRFLKSIIPFALLTPINGDGESYIDVTGDVASALLTFEMAKGPNVVFAEYHYDCMPNIKGNARAIRNFDETQRCQTSVDKNIVMYPIMINYQEKTLPGTSVIERDRSVCEREAQDKK